MSFCWDIFISYGWSQNGLNEGDRQWVQTLREKLREALRTPEGKDPAIFLDIEATRAGALTPILEHALDHSRLFFFVISPGSCRSNWCNWEILRFLDRAHSPATAIDVMLPEDRIFCAQLEPTARERIPAPLQPLVPRPFDLTYRIQGRDATRPVPWDQLTEYPAASNEFDTLIVDLSNRLKKVQEFESTPVPQTGVTVFVGTAPSQPHETHNLIPLRRDLLIRGHRAIRASATPDETEENYRIRLDGVLAEAHLSAHILAEPAARLDWQRPIGAWQIRRAAGHGGLALFTWVDPDRKADSRELAEILQPGDHHFDRRQPFADLKTAVLHRADELAYRAQTSSKGYSGQSVVIAYCLEDRPHAAAISERLRGNHGLQAQLALPPTDKPGDRNRINKGLFQEMDAVLVYYSEHDEWMVHTCGKVRKARKIKTPSPRTVLVVHPPPPPKDDCDQVGFLSLRRSHSEDFDAIDAWARQLKGQTAKGAIA